MSESATWHGEVEVTRFEFPLVEGGILGEGDLSGPMPTARQLEQVHERAYQEGFEIGRGEGFDTGTQAAAADVHQRLTALDGILGELAAPLAELDNEVIESVADLALLIARHLVRRELKTAPGEVVGVVREALKQLPLASRATTVRLNPDDVDLVRNALSIREGEGNLRLDSDPLVARGGCVVDTETSRIDASVESRLAAIASQMFGGERESDRGTSVASA